MQLEIAMSLLPLFFTKQFFGKTFVITLFTFIKHCSVGKQKMKVSTTIESGTAVNGIAESAGVPSEKHQKPVKVYYGPNDSPAWPTAALFGLQVNV